MNNKPLVSVLTPAYNSEELIGKTIESVLKQTYQNWEMIIVDDCSTDHTKEIVQKMAEQDRRIHFFELNTNQGAGPARNRALELASGQYVAYLDADDLWYPEKLEKQVAFMQEKHAAFSCASYEVISHDGTPLNKKIHMLPVSDYDGFLTNNLLQTVGIMVDVSVVDKKFLHMPPLRRRQDSATWLQVLREGYKCYGMNEVLAAYRRTLNSLSGNKLKAVKGTWNLYRHVEKLSLPYCCFCFVRYALLAVKKRIYISGFSDM